MLYKTHIHSECFDERFILQKIKPEFIQGDIDLNYTGFFINNTFFQLSLSVT